VGQALGSQDVEIRARVEGFLETVNFTEGTLVKKGQLLYQIDPKPFEAALANQKANLATWQSRLEKTNNDVKRLTPLAKQQAVSQMELDNAVSSRDAAAAQVDAQKAQVDKAALDLGYTKIFAPVDGLVGTTKVKPGNLVGRGESTLLTTISVIDPIFFRVGIAEAEYMRLARRTEERKAAGTWKPVEGQLILADVGVAFEPLTVSTGPLPGLPPLVCFRDFAGTEGRLAHYLVDHPDEAVTRSHLDLLLFLIALVDGARAVGFEVSREERRIEALLREVEARRTPG
jgi:biotin carboxyl carrier protein